MKAASESQISHQPQLAEQLPTETDSRDIVSLTARRKWTDNCVKESQIWLLNWRPDPVPDLPPLSITPSLLGNDFQLAAAALLCLNQYAACFLQISNSSELSGLPWLSPPAVWDVFLSLQSTFSQSGCWREPTFLYWLSADTNQEILHSNISPNLNRITSNAALIELQTYRYSQQTINYHHIKNNEDWRPDKSV